MVSRRLLAAPVRLLSLFILLSGVPLAALGWLTWRVLEQDRALENQRLRERLDNAASLLARELDRTLTGWEELLPAAAAGQSVTLPPRAVFLLIDANGLVQHQGAALAYYPRVPSTSAETSSVFAAAEIQEFREQNLPAAIAAYRALAATRNELVRAEALMRLARCLRKQRQVHDALQAYDNLTELGGVPVAGSPAELVARRERIAMLQAIGDADAVARERALLTAALSEGRYQLDRPSFDYFGELAASDVTQSPASDAPLPLARAVERLWLTWLGQPTGRTALTSSSGTFVSVWRDTLAGTATLTVALETMTASLPEALRNLQVDAQFDDRDGRRIWGHVADAQRVTKTSRETGLPWSLHVGVDPVLASSIADSRRNLFAAGFALMTLVVCAASYFVFRAVTRELRVARLQSDFVAAVSHEFRTPLTAMCHLTEMLEEGGARPDRLAEYYHALGKESRRLHTMVENLLDFGRMDSGRRSYDFCETNAVALVDRVVQEYGDRSPAAAHRIERSIPAFDAAAIVRADREALALAVRNLLDNAIKYSPESSPVRLAVAQQNGTVAVSIEDRGPGIGVQERREIFRKFTRGAAARNLNVKGTGIGLTMAREIVKAHGGRLELKSEPGRGSTFTIVLPAMASA